MTFIDIDLPDTTSESIYRALIATARHFKNNHLDYNEKGIKLVVTCIPDTVDRIEWLCDGLHISASYAKVLIERSISE